MNKFFDIEYEIIKAILNPNFKDKLKNDDIINQFLDAKSELENLKNNNKKMQNKLSALIISSIDMGVILKNLAANCKVDSVKFENDQKENANFIITGRIINRLIDNEHSYEVSIKAFVSYQKEQDCRNASAFSEIFQYNSYKAFWKYVAKLHNMEVYVNSLLDSKIKFKDKECQKLQVRFLKYKEVRGETLKDCTNGIVDGRVVSGTSRPIYDIEFSIDKDGALSLVKEVEISCPVDINSINGKKPFSFWKIVLLLAIVLAFGGTGFFGFNALLAFVTFVTNFWSIIIALVALIALPILLVVAHKTGAFKIGKLFCSAKYENNSWFYLRQGKEHDDKSKIGTKTIDPELI